jgi:hypothetical protein
MEWCGPQRKGSGPSKCFTDISTALTSNARRECSKAGSQNTTTLTVRTIPTAVGGTIRLVVAGQKKAALQRRLGQRSFGDNQVKIIVP